MDIIVCWPRNCDYPLWRQFIRTYREYFNDVIIVFTETNQGEDYKPFVRNAMAEDNCVIYDSPAVPSGEDWRNVAVNSALERSGSNIVWFTEQDFLITDTDHFMATVMSELAYSDVIGFYSGERLHPASLIMKRSTLEETSKNFGIVPGEHDHFYLITKSILGKEVKLSELDDIGLVEGKDWVHMNGLSHNHTLLERGEDITYYPEEFKKYLSNCLKVVVPLNDKWVEYAKRIL